MLGQTDSNSLTQIQEAHSLILESIEKTFQDVETDIQLRITRFRKYNSKKYTSNREIKGYSKWKRDVLKRFHRHCCICLSNERLVAHHLNSYKYFPEHRLALENGVCLCDRCHIRFHELYENRNTVGQFFEFNRVMKDNTLREYAKTARNLYNIRSFTKDLKTNGEEFELMDLTHLRIVKFSGNVYSGVIRY